MILGGIIGNQSPNYSVLKFLYILDTPAGAVTRTTKSDPGQAVNPHRLAVQLLLWGQVQLEEVSYKQLTLQSSIILQSQSI